MTKGATLALIALAAGLGVFVGRWTAKNSAVEVDVESSGTAPESSPGAPAPRAAPDLAAHADPVADAFRSAMTKLPAPKVPTGNGSISGTVLTSAGQPLAGVVITVSPQGGKPGRDIASGDPDPAEVVRAYAESLAWAAATKRTGTSGADGKYVVTGLSDDDLFVRASLDGWRIAQAWQADLASRAARSPRSPRGPTRPGAVVDFTATPLTTIAFDVRLPNGTTPTSASVEWKSAGRSSSTSWRADGKPTNVDPGPLTVTARGGEGDLYASDSVEVTVEAGKSVSVRLDLRERPVIRVRLRWPPGEEFPYPSVRFAELTADDKPDASLLTGERDAGRLERRFQQTTDGVYVIRNVDAGRYLVGVARYDGGPIAVFDTVTVASTVADVELVVPPAERSSYLVLRVLDPDGKPVPDAETQLSAKSSRNSWSGGGVTLKRPDGSIWLFPQSAGDMGSDARFWVHAIASTFGRATVEYSPGSAPEATIRFQAPGRVEVVCEALRGSKLLPRLTASVVPADETRHGYGRTNERFSREGVAVVAPVQPGACEVVIALASQEWGPSTICRVPTTVASGTQRVAITLPHLNSVTFRTKANAGYLSLQRDDDRTFQRGVQTSGEATLVDALTDGTYSANLGGRTTSFTLPGPTEVDLR